VLDGICNYELTVVGSGPEESKLRQMAEGKNVRFEGFQSDTAKYYRNADVFIMPSLGPEGLPLVTLEAMSHGLPCILSDLPVHVEVSCNGNAASLFKTGNVESLKASLRRLCESDSERRELGARAYQQIQQKYSAAAAREAMLKVLTA